ncbi:MAG: hypothetical protein V3V00_04195 [Saprospiraceae bacterium]
MNNSLLMVESVFPHMWEMQDVLLAPMYIIIIYWTGRLLRGRYTRDKPETRKYFMPALVLRMIGCVFSIWMYDFYFGGSDMAGYYNSSMAIASSLINSPATFLEIMWQSPSQYSDQAIDFFQENKSAYYLQAHSTIMMSKIGGLLAILSLGSIYGMGLILSFFSFLGCWKLYEIFYSRYPHLYKKLAYAVLFVPSIIFWGGAGLMKDTVVLGCIGYCVFSFDQLFFLKKQKILSLSIVILTTYAILILKAYVALSLFPSILMWIILEKQKNIKNRLLRAAAKPIFFASGLSIGLLALISLSGQTQSNFSLSSILDYAKGFQAYSLQQTLMAGGVGYDLGEYESSFGGLIKMVPLSINVTFFRPYLWEVKKLILVPGSIESLLTFCFAVYVVLKVGLLKSIRRIWSNPTLLFCIGFSFFFAFAIGFSTYNFGTLARYKIIALPFFYAGLVILADKKTRKKIKRRPLIH